MYARYMYVNIVKQYIHIYMYMCAWVLVCVCTSLVHEMGDVLVCTCNKVCDIFIVQAVYGTIV